MIQKRCGVIVAAVIAAVLWAAPLFSEETTGAQWDAAGKTFTQADAGNGAPKSDSPAAMKPGHITVNFKGADIRTVLSYFAEVSGIDIVPSPDVKGLVDLKLTDKHWKTALDIIVRNYGFAYEQEGDIIRVVTVDGLKMEEVTTQAFSLSYAKSESVVTSIQDMLSEKGNISFDERTNTVIVTDLPTNVYKIGDIIKRLDTSTPQVLIEARIIETVLGNNEKLGIDWNLVFAAAGSTRPTTFPFHYYKSDSRFIDQFYPLVQTGAPVVSVPPGGSPQTADPGGYPAGASAQGERVKGFPLVDHEMDLFADAFKFGTLDFSQLTATLELIKERSNTDVISNPRITTLDNKEASILVGHVIWMPKYERNKNTGQMEISGYDPKDVGIKLKVTPHINVRSEIIVELEPEITELLRYDTLNEQEGVVVPVFSTRTAKTQVLLFSGDTIFIGGLIKEYDKTTINKVPLLGDMFDGVPGLEMLFKHTETVKEKTELVFFVSVNLVTTGRHIAGTPLPTDVYAPNFTMSQERWPTKGHTAD